MTDRAVLLPERFRAGCAFGAGPVLTGPVSPTGQIEVGIVRPPYRLAKRATRPGKPYELWPDALPPRLLCADTRKVAVALPISVTIGQARFPDLGEKFTGYGDLS